MRFDFSKHEGETEHQYKYRVYQAKWDGLLDDCTWQDIADHLNKELRPDEPEYGESVYRKEAALIKEWQEQLFHQAHDESDLLYEIQKERVRLRDERTSYNRQAREEARRDQQWDHLADTIRSFAKEKYVPIEPVCRASDNDMVILLSDWHIGQTFSGKFAAYDSDMAQLYLEEFFGAVQEAQKLYQAANAYVFVLGDMISGGIHSTVRLEERENRIEQVKIASHLLTEFLHQCAGIFTKVRVAAVPGNHSRMGLKDDVLRGERLDNLIAYISKEATAHIQNIEWDDRRYDDDTTARMYVRNHKVLAVHGDHDALSSEGIGKLAMWDGGIPDILLMGHLHTPSYQEIGGVQVIRGGCLCGSGDNYTQEHRMVGKPSQTILVVDDYGIKAHLPVRL